VTTPLEELLNEDFREEPGLSAEALFGGWAWFVNGNFFCGAN
jgi:hypothetical protein